MSLDVMLKPLNSTNKTEVRQLLEATGLWAVMDQEGPRQDHDTALVTRPAADPQCRLNLQPQGPAASAPLQPLLPEPRGGGPGGRAESGFASPLVSLIQEIQVPWERHLAEGTEWAPNTTSCCFPPQKRDRLRGRTQSSHGGLSTY